MNRLFKAKKRGTLSSFMKQISKAELVICDDWGYVPLDRTGAKLLFEVIYECYERKTLTINTSNEFSRWVNVFYDEQMTGAILDRMLHNCHLLLFPGPSNQNRELGLSRKETEEYDMLLTKKVLREILENMRVWIPEEVEKELLEQYGIYATDEEGHEFEYTEQEIYEQLRKKLRPYEKDWKSSCISF